MGMPRQPRLDRPGTLHHVMGRGIEGTKIFRKDADRVGGGETGISGSEGGALPRGDDIGGGPCSLFRGFAGNGKILVSSLRTNVPLLCPPLNSAISFRTGTPGL